MERLDHFLANESSFSRSEVKKLIKEGRVTVGGQDRISPQMKIDPELDRVCVDRVPVRAAGRICLMMNKPAGYLSATKDSKAATVIDLVAEPYADRLFPIGRLDKDTEGLLLLTNDGMLSHNLLSPSKHVSKTYFAIISGAPDEQMAERFMEGLDIGEKKKTLPSRLRFLSVDGDFLEEYVTQSSGVEHEQKMPAGMISARKMQEFCMKSIALADFARCGEEECLTAVCVTEGKFHQIKRMFHSCGREVHFLKRIAMGEVMLDPALESGMYRMLTNEEWTALGG